jgi:hypothetical protein
LISISGSSRATRAAAVKGQLVGVQDIAIGQQMAQIARAGVNVKHLLTMAAMEMVVVVVAV